MCAEERKQIWLSQQPLMSGGVSLQLHWHGSADFQMIPNDCGSCAMQERAIALLTAATMHCDDEDRLQRVVPYLLVIPLPACPPVALVNELKALRIYYRVLGCLSYSILAVH